MKKIELAEVKDFHNCEVAVNVKIDGFSLSFARTGSRMNFYKRGGRKLLTFVDRLLLGQYEKPIDHILKNDWMSLPEGVQFFVECFKDKIYMSYAKSEGKIHGPNTDIVGAATVQLNLYGAPVVYFGATKEFDEKTINLSAIDAELTTPLEGYVFYVTDEHGDTKMFRHLTKEYSDSFKKTNRSGYQSIVNHLIAGVKDDLPDTLLERSTFLYWRIHQSAPKMEPKLRPSSFLAPFYDSELLSCIVSVLRKHFKEEDTCTLFPGRFQPFHLGHFNAAFDDGLVVFAAVRGKNTQRHRFTQEETRQMIINGCGKDPALVIETKDGYVPRIVDEVWNKYALKVKRVVSGPDRDYTKMLDGTGIETVKSERLISGTEIVNAALKGGIEWIICSSFVADANKKIIESRLKQLDNSFEVGNQ